MLGIVKKGKVVLEGDNSLPEGTRVMVTPLAAERGSIQAVLNAMEATRPARSEDVDELLRVIDEGKLPVRHRDCFSGRKKTQQG